MMAIVHGACYRPAPPGSLEFSRQSWVSCGSPPQLVVMAKGGVQDRVVIPAQVLVEPAPHRRRNHGTQGTCR